MKAPSTLSNALSGALKAFQTGGAHKPLHRRHSYGKATKMNGATAALDKRCK